MDPPGEKDADPAPTVAAPLERAVDPVGQTEAAPLLVVGGLTSPTLGADHAPPLVAGRYEILGMLGAGGMGTVYRARDRELDEVVALKVLRKELAAAPGMLDRFRREVKLARRVTHRNVARTFDIGENAGDRFLTMELIEGEMLGNHLARRGRVSLRDVIPIARDVCAGLGAAHEAGVLHRDLKPENVIIARDGRAVITDFGIARAAVGDAELARTGAGGLLGTPAYMAPEQVEGSRDLDGRADLYALGVMLFELLTGKMAWPGDNVIAIAAGRLLRPPPDPRVARPELSDGAAELVLKLMARRREDRFSSAEEAGEALAILAGTAHPSSRSIMPASEAPRIAAVPASRKTVAVLPIVNLGAADDEYLAQTVTEDLVDLLSMVRELRVRPRGETMRFADATRDVREAGRTLGVDVVIDGSLRRLGVDQVRVSVRLVTVEDGFQLWACRFDRPAASVVAVADEAASAIAHALAAELTTSARPVVADPVAQDLYLRGRYLIHRGWLEVSDAGVKLLREAHSRAPDDARIAGAYALAISRTLANEPNPQASVNTARELAERALTVDPSQPDARVALGFLHLGNGEGAAAASQLLRAIRVAPNSVEALDAVGRLLVEIGRARQGIAMLRRALSIDPAISQAFLTTVRAHVLLGEDELAHELLGPIPDQPAQFIPQMLLRARLALWRHDGTTAQALLEHVERNASSTAKRGMVALLTVAITGKLSSAHQSGIEQGLAFDTKLLPRRLCFHGQMRTEIKLGAGDIEGALADLRTSDQNGLLDVLWLDCCPLFDGHRERADFLAIRETTDARADRVLQVLEPDSLVADP